MTKKMCKIFNCDRHRESRCCFTCEDYHRCANRCLNSPRRCGQAEYPKPKRQRRHHEKENSEKAH